MADISFPGRSTLTVATPEALQEMIGTMQVTSGYDGYIMSDSSTDKSLAFLWRLDLKDPQTGDVLSVECANYLAASNSLFPEVSFDLTHTRILEASETAQLRFGQGQSLTTGLILREPSTVIGYYFVVREVHTAVLNREDYPAGGQLPTGELSLRQPTPATLIYAALEPTEAQSVKAPSSETTYWDANPSRCTDFTGSHNSQILHMSQTGGTVMLYRSINSDASWPQTLRFKLKKRAQPPSGSFHLQKILKR